MRVMRVMVSLRVMVILEKRHLCWLGDHPHHPHHPHGRPEWPEWTAVAARSEPGIRMKAAQATEPVESPTTNDDEQTKIERRGGGMGRLGKGPTPTSWTPGNTGNRSGRPPGFKG